MVRPSTRYEDSDEEEGQGDKDKENNANADNANTKGETTVEEAMEKMFAEKEEERTTIFSPPFSGGGAGSPGTFGGLSPTFRCVRRIRNDQIKGTVAMCRNNRLPMCITHFYQQCKMLMLYYQICQREL